MDQLVGAQGQVKVTKKTQKPILTFPQQTPNQKQKIFFLMSTRRLAKSVEVLNSSLALTAGN